MERIYTLSFAVLLFCQTACTNLQPFSLSDPPAAATDSALSKNSMPSKMAKGTMIAVVATPQMTSKRAGHTATLLADGTVLIAGGFADEEAKALPSAEIFDPETESFSAINPMNGARQSHTATLLPNGKVLLAGGFNGDYLAGAELYDPATRQFVPTGSMKTARMGHVAVVLNEHQVLLAGGTGVGWAFLESAEIYDVESGTFAATGDMAAARVSHTATLLKNGQVLIAGGHHGRRSAIEIYDSAELYDPLRGEFAPAGKMTVARHKHDATLLADGRVFISGGADERDARGAYGSTEIFDLGADKFTPAGEMHTTRYKHQGTSLLLQNGMVLLVGGANTTEIYDPQNGSFYKAADGVGSTRFFATATLLGNGQVLFAGGYGLKTRTDAQAWILSPG